MAETIMKTDNLREYFDRIREGNKLNQCYFTDIIIGCIGFYTPIEIDLAQV